MNELYANSFIPPWELLNKSYLNQKYAVCTTFGDKVSLDNFVSDKLVSTRFLTLFKKTTRNKTSKFRKRDKITVFFCKKESFQEEATIVLALVSALNKVSDSVGETISSALPKRISKQEDWETFFEIVENFLRSLDFDTLLQLCVERSRQNVP